MSRHKVLAIRDQYLHEIEPVQEWIKVAIEIDYLDAQYKALALIEHKMDPCSPLQLVKVCDAVTNRMMAFETPVQTSPQPLSIKLAALRRAK